MRTPSPAPPTLGDLLAGPVVLDIHQTRRALCMGENQAYERLAAGTFPVEPMEPHKRGAVARFRLADVLAALGFGPADALRELGVIPASSVPAAQDAA